MSKVLYEQRGAIAEVTLNRPDKLNAIDEDMLAGLETALDTAAMGLVNHVVEAGSLMQHARGVAAEIAANDPVAVRLTKQAINRSVEVAGLRQALEEALAIDLEIELTDTPESREFNRILEVEGPKAALKWRASQSYQVEGNGSAV